ncbi:hypothetical protein [Thalassotalea fusca]
MRITATHIENWAQTRQAQAELPIWIRKLISATNSLSELSMPGGDSVYRPGWDGKIVSSNTSAWVPEGKSVWEMGCNSKVTSKANSDFNKRTKDMCIEFQKNNSFVFVTPHRWHKKEEWLNEKKKLGNWKEIRVLDADDIETWFENAPAVALEFGEQIGISGNGAESVTSYWKNWSEQSSPCISISAIQQDRETAQNKFIELLENLSPLITIEADSREEAAAFCSSIIMSHPLSKRAACITSNNGWRWIDANPEIQIVIIASTDLSLRKAPRDGFTVIQPICHGDDTKLRNDNAENVSIPRVSPDAFKLALIELGEEQNDARRLTSSSGRSWSVYRRLKAVNPLISKPAWLDGVDKDSLVVLLLVGAWNSSSQGDVAMIEELTQKPYEDIEDSLSNLVTQDDSPVVNIRNIWKAKSPVELLYQVAPKLSKSKLLRFITLAKAVLSKPDPALELPENDRWMANIYGKVRDESGIVINSLLNSLIKLKVYGESTDLSISHDIKSNVDTLIYELLCDANEEVWMSLASYLPSLAEASPDIFMRCVEMSLSKAEQPITCLIKNTAASGLNSRCWYTGLLWALETIAWNPSKLRRVTNILIELDNVPNDTNWGNKPFATLQSFYRAFSPQALATVDQKIQILESVIKSNEQFAWKFIISLIPRGGGSYGLNNSRPNWRDDDAGSECEQGVYYPHYLSWIGNTVLNLAKGKPKRIAKLMDCYSSFDGEYKERLLSLINDVREFDDAGKEIIIDRLRRHISFHQTDDIDDKDKYVDQLIATYYDSQPNDLIVRYRWLFRERWIDMPEGERRDYEKTEQLRHEYRFNAITHIWDELAEEGIERLISSVEDKWQVGNYTAKLLTEEHFNKLVSLAITVFKNNNYQYQDSFLNGVINYVTLTKQSSLLNVLESYFNKNQFTIEQQVSLLACLPPNLDVFAFIDGIGDETSDAYWQKISFYYRMDEKLFEFILNKYISLNRYHSAFSLIEYDVKKVPPRLVYEILHNMLTVQEEGATYSNGTWIKKAIKCISDTDEINQKDLARLEYAYYPVFNNPESIPKNLHDELLNSPSTFVELVCLTYKAEGKYHLKDDVNSNEYARTNAWKILHYGRGMPGMREDRSIDIDVFNNWVNEVREAGRSMDRETMTDQSIGQWLSKCPEQEEGVWPCYPVCELLEKSDASNIRKAFATGIHNNRGVVTRAYRGGGSLERDLATKYKCFAEKVNDIYPKTAQILIEIANYYEYQAKQEDDEAKLGDELD